MIDSTVAAFTQVVDMVGGKSNATTAVAAAGGPIGSWLYEQLMGGNRDEDTGGKPRNVGGDMAQENEERMQKYGEREEARRVERERIRNEGKARVEKDKKLAEEEDKTAAPAIGETGLQELEKEKPKVKAPEEVISGSFGATSAASMFLGARKDNVANQQLEEARQQTQLLQMVVENTGEGAGAGGLE